MGTRQWRRLLIVSTLTALIALAVTQAVSAHARPVSSDPADKAILNRAPTQVLITFSEETSPTKSGGSVLDASGATVSTGFKVDLNNRTKMTIDLKPNLPNGTYTVKWNTLTEDDSGTADGTFTFTVQAQVTGTGTPSGGTSGSAAAGSAPAGSPAASATAATGSAPSLPPAPTPSATAAPTATRAATTAAATGTGGGSATTGTATQPPAALPSTGNANGGASPPWAVIFALAAAAVVGGGVALRLRATRH